MKFLKLYIFISVVIWAGCSKNNSLDRGQSFGKYNLEEVITFDRQNAEISFYEGDEKAIAFMDSLLSAENQDSWNFKRFVLIHNLFNQYDTKGEEVAKNKILNQYLDLLAHPDFDQEHILNRALTSYYTYRVLFYSDNNKLARFHLENAISLLQNEDEEKYAKILCLFYSQFSDDTFWNWESKEKSLELMDKAINICESANSYFDLDFLYRRKIIINKQEGNKLEALSYYDDLERVVRNTRSFSKDNLWRRCYLNKIPLFFELDVKYPNGGYQDSIIYYFDRLDSEYENKEISDPVFRQIIKNNLNSLIRVGRYELAQTYIDELDELYQNDTEINCLAVAYLNMNKYVMQRNVGNRQSLRAALVNAFDHMESCGGEENIYYGTLRSNVLAYLMQLDKEKGDFKNSLKWSQFRYADLKNKKNKSNVESKISQAEFWAHREQKYAEQAVLLENEKTHAAVQKIYLVSSILVGLFVLSLLIFFQYLKIRKQKLKNEEDHELVKKINQKLSDLNSELEESKEELFQQKIEIEAELKSKMLYIMQRNNGTDQLIKEIKSLNLDWKNEKKLIEFANPKEQKVYWEDIEDQYLNQHKGFVIYLQEKYPKLTSSNIKLLILVKLGMSNKEIAALKFVSPSSVKVAISRLRKKLQIDASETNLYTFLNTLKSSKVMV